MPNTQKLINSYLYSFTFCAVFFCMFLFFSGFAYGNQNIPKVKLTTRPMNLSASPSTKELMSAGQLGGQLYPTKTVETNTPKSRKNNLDFGHAIQAWNKHEYKKAVRLFRKILKENSDNPWAAESALHIGCDARYNGRYTEAEDMFNWIIRNFENSEHPGAKRLANKALLRLGILKMVQNDFSGAQHNFIKLKTDSSSWRQRTYASHWIQRLSQLKTQKQSLMNCGVKALAVLLENDGKREQADIVKKMRPSSEMGYSLSDLKRIAATYNYPVTGRQMAIQDLRNILLPAIIQLPGSGKSSGHFWVLEKIDSAFLTFYDPQSRRRFKQTENEFAQEWDGITLIFTDQENLPGIALQDEELDKIFGGCCGAPIQEGNLGSPGQNAGPVSNAPLACEYGSPVWSINMTNMNFYVVDIPIWYASPIGPSVNIKLSYNSQSAIAYNEPFGNKWMFNYSSYLVVDTGGDVLVFMPDGKRDTYSYDGSGGYSPPIKCTTHFREFLKTILNSHFLMVLYIHIIFPQAQIHYSHFWSKFGTLMTKD